MLASSSNRRRLVGLLALTAVGIAGCGQPEIDRPGTWKPTGINEQNLRAMLANPQDAYGGSGMLTARGNSASRAVTRLLTDRRRPLLDASVSHVGSSAIAPANSGPLPPPGGGPTGGTQ